MKFASKLFNKLKYITMIVLVSTVVSCDSWLDLGSEDRIMENTLFSSQTGFMTALNGVYIAECQLVWRHVVLQDV